MDLVQSQKQLNSVIRETHQGLTSKGVDVKRRTIEEVLSPILVSGKSHPVASSHLKSKPNSTQGMVHNLIVNGDNDNVVMMLNQLSESIANASVFNSELSRLGDRFAYDIEAVELSSFSAIQNSKETVDTINKVTQAFRTKDMFDVCHVSIKEIDRQSEHYWFDIELVINKHSIKFVAESISTITLKEYVFNGVDILSGKESSPIAKELISWVKLVSRLFKENNFGSSILFSNRFDLNVSPSLIEMLVESAQKPTFSRKSVVNKESKVALGTNDDFEKFYLISPEKGLLGSNGSYTSSVDDAALLYESEADDFLSLYPEDGYQKVAFTSCRNIPEKNYIAYCGAGTVILALISSKIKKSLSLRSSISALISGITVTFLMIVT